MSSPCMTQAVVAAYATIPTQSPALPTDLSFEEVAEDKLQLPVAQYRHLGEPPIPQAYPTDAAKPVALNGSFSITLWGLSLVQLQAWAIAVMTAYNPNSIDITGAHCSTFRTNYQENAAGLRDANGAPVRSVTMTWKVFISNPPA